ncbi:DUF481 domain-containing protein [Polaribacter uvawellassae]|uniref:DUF481 domain-containing protein n=1 Tax=Polaribacter uvawellassae TaxID=3133495 RepID=UPI00321AEF50
MLFLGFLGCNFLLNAQVINVEGVRNSADSARFIGKASLDLELTKNVNKEFNLSSDLTLQYSFKKNTFLFLNKLEFKEANGKNFTNKSVQHLRYNYRFHKKIALESFVQFQKDQVSFINYRTLIGLGTRNKIYQSKKNTFFLGTLIMYEHENSVGINADVIEKNMRGDIYFSFILRPKKVLSITSTTYYQPKLDAFSDYRISSETSLIISLFKNLDLTTTFSYQFDTFPVIGIPKEQYKLENGITFSF